MAPGSMLIFYITTASLEYQLSDGKLYILLQYIHAIKTFSFKNFCALNVDLSYYSLADPSSSDLLTKLPLHSAIKAFQALRA